MSKHTSKEIYSALLRVEELFKDHPQFDANLKDVKDRLSEVARGYRDHRAFSDDTWISRSQMSRAIRSIQSDLRRARRTLDHPVLLRYVNQHHPRNYRERSTAQDLSDALSALGWALTCLEGGDPGSGGERSGRQRRTRTSTRDQYLIPRLTQMVLDFVELDVDDPDGLQELEKLLRVLLREWAFITGSAYAENYHKIARKPLRRLIRNAVDSGSEGGDK